MLEMLKERETEEMFRTEVRVLECPDGEARRIEAYRLVWRWFDRLAAYEFAPDADRILHYALRAMDEEDLEIGVALGRVVDFFVEQLERQGADITDDDLEALAAKRGRQRMRERRAGRG